MCVDGWVGNVEMCACLVVGVGVSVNVGVALAWALAHRRLLVPARSQV